MEAFITLCLVFTGFTGFVGLQVWLVRKALQNNKVQIAEMPED